MITVTLPAPLSVNAAYSGRRFLTAAAKQFKRDAHYATLEARQLAGDPTLDPAALYAVDVTLYYADNRRHDLDNTLKLALDAVTGALGIDDSRVWDIHIRRRVSYTGAAWAELRIEPLEDKRG